MSMSARFEEELSSWLNELPQDPLMDDSVYLDEFGEHLAVWHS